MKKIIVCLFPGQLIVIASIRKMISGFDITISYLDGKRNMPQEGIYYVSATDWQNDYICNP